MHRLITLVAATAFVALMGAAMFLLAGTTNAPPIWLYLAIRVGFNAACVLAMSEDVARERLKPGPGAKAEPVYNIGTGIAWVAHILLACLDLGRFGWSAGFPTWLQALGVLGTLGGMGLVVWALRHNEFLSGRIRIQADRGQHVVDTGPYAIIRHPNNAGGCLIGLCSGLVLTSWASIPPILIYVWLTAWRTLNEERVLFVELPGYPEYAQRVRYRFVPGVW